LSPRIPERSVADSSGFATVSPAARAFPGGETALWIAGPDLIGSLGSELFFLARNGHGLTGRLGRVCAAAIPALTAPWAARGGRSLELQAAALFLRGMSRDRLELLGEEYFDTVIRSRISRSEIDRVAALASSNQRIIAISHALEPVLRPLAAHLGIDSFVSNRIEYRDGIATGRLLDPILLPDNLSSIDANAWARPVSDPGRAPRRVVFGNPHAPELSIRRAFHGKKILLIGATGFIGKVFLAKVFHDLPEIDRVIVLARAKSGVGAGERIARVIDRSPLFDVVRDHHGADFDRLLAEKMEILEGDVARSHLGLDAGVAERLAEEVDIVVNCAGLTEFNPDLREAVRTNVESTLHLMQFLRASRRAALLHVSTCFAAGSREGCIRESPFSQETPSGALDFNARGERSSLHSWIREETQSDEHSSNGSSRSRKLRDRLVQRGLERARELGWPNIYTYTKGLAEALLVEMGADLPVVIVRPSIVESARSFPFRGWNEGINTSAPLSYVLGTWFRQLPVRRQKRLDVIPVDDVVRGMTIAAAALLERRAPRVIHLATSAAHPLDMRRTVELTALAHRRHYAALRGWKSWALARMDAIPVSRGRYERFSIPAQAALMKAVNRVMAPLLGGSSSLRRIERNLVRVGKLIELYEPFILHNEHVFEADMIERLSALVPEEERAMFGYDVHDIDWARYWTRVHIPGLRRWSYPLIEGRQPETRSRRTEAAASPANTRREGELVSKNGRSAS
jgi:long-chain acyl-CoA synthetase